MAYGSFFGSFCVFSKYLQFSRLKVRLGDVNHSSANDDQYVQERNIEQVDIHPKYVESKAYYDIAVLIIPPIQFTKRVRPICLPRPLVFEQDKYEGRLATLIGWGNDVHSGKASTKLKKTTLEIYDYRWIFIFVHLLFINSFLISTTWQQI